MPVDVECTHCRVLMTSWSAAQSQVRYWQCPTCGRTHSSLYAESFQRGGGGRRVEAPAAAAARLPQARPEDVAWTQLKARAARWFARLEQEQLPAPPRPKVRAVPARALQDRAPPGRR